MEIPNKRELQQIGLNHSSDFMKIYKKCTVEPYSFSVNDKIKTIDDQIRDEKLQYNINREAAKIFVFSSGKINKYEYLTGEEILPSNQKQLIEQAKFTYSALGKVFEKQKQLKTNEKNK